MVMDLLTPQVLAQLEALFELGHFEMQEIKHEAYGCLGIHSIAHNTRHGKPIASVSRICTKPNIIIIKTATLLVFIVFFPITFLQVSALYLKILYRCYR